jgi:hypothetical protein
MRRWKKLMLQEADPRKHHMTADTLIKPERLDPLVLSPIEAAFWRVEENFDGAYRAVVLFRLDGCIAADLLTSALWRVQCRHPKLRAQVKQGDDGRLRYVFENTPRAIPFEIRDYGEEDFPWREQTRRLLQRGFPANGPFAAVTVLRSRARGRSDLLLLVHHAIADGLAAIMLVDDLLTEYAKVETESDSPPPSAMPPVTAVRAKSSSGWLSRFWLARRFLRLRREDKRLHQTHLPQAPDIPQQSEWSLFVFSPEETVRLVRRCRKERTSLGGVLVAAVCTALMECLDIPKGVFKCQFPLNVREQLDAPGGRVTPQDLGCFVSLMTEIYEVSQRPAFWKLARYTQRALEIFTRHGGPSFCYNMAAVASSRMFARAVPRLLASRERVTLLANNYGVLNVANKYGSLRPLECTLTFRNYADGPSLVVQALVLAQRLNVGIVADGLDPAFWNRFQLAVHSQLEKAEAIEDTGYRRESGVEFIGGVF